MLNLLKWTATATLIVGFAYSSLGMYPTGPIIQLFGGVLWLAASVAMKDKPLIVTNVVMTAVGAAGLIWVNFFL
jgi:hypothetical protein